MGNEYCSSSPLHIPFLFRRSVIPAQGLIELNQGEQFVASRLSQVQLGGEQVAIGVEGVELRIHSALISQISQARPVL